MKTQSLLFVKYILSSCLIASTSLVCFSQSRGVDWIHGLGGNSSSLQEVATFYQSNRPILLPSRNSYPTGDGISSMATMVQTYTGGANRIGIGHSMGGAAIRHVTLGNNIHWSGVVTMASPLRGAQIAASGYNGTNAAFINNGINRMMAGPGVGAGSAPPLYAGLGLKLDPVSGLLGEIFSQSIAGKVNDILMSSFGLTGQTATDLSPGSAYQNSKVGLSASVPKILIWGNESYPILWRTVGTYAKDNSADDDGVNKASQIANQYNLIANGEEAASWVNLPLHGFHQMRKNKWQEGKNWINTDSNTGWRQVIGATWVETVNGTYWENTCSEEYYYTYCDTQPDPAQCRSYCILTYPTAYNIYHDIPSDGVVTQESATNQGGAWQGFSQQAFGNINHGEFKRINRIQDTMNWVFDGGNNSSVFRIHN
ncbi:hypothetical protein [Dyadobacter luticola]|uniref:Alpha/beta hydrolase n=1 Tax=Dyadobacter luticola TaxID=1979387 RepID=A0A5R9KVS8_9BACT|nr:hypothetical protein [Dyadobacter luticola]TLV00382.1 hypothetical protein FEN17_12885 [Dyadobacter luticola]